MSTIRSSVLAISSLVLPTLFVALTFADEHENAAEFPKVAVAVLQPLEGSDVRGTVLLREVEEGVHLLGKVQGLSPGKHGFHIHQYGDLRDPEGKSAGGHFNPHDTKHGAPTDKQRHAGDLGNIVANSRGEATVDIVAKGLKLHFVVGRSIVVHAGEDDLTSQPSGDAGSRAALGVIGLAQVDEKSK